MAQINVSINGRNFRMACDDGEEDRLIGLAKRFDGCIEELRSSFGEIGDQRLTVMAGIMVLDELSELEKKVASLEGAVESAQSERSDAVAKLSRSEGDVVEKIDEAAKRIEAIAESLNRSLKSAD